MTRSTAAAAARALTALTDAGDRTGTVIRSVSWAPWSGMRIYTDPPLTLDQAEVFVSYVDGANQFTVTTTNALDDLSDYSGAVGGVAVELVIARTYTTSERYAAAADIAALADVERPRLDDTETLTAAYQRVLAGMPNPDALVRLAAAAKVLGIGGDS